LSADEKLLETIFSHLSEAVFILDEASGGLVYANRVMRSLFGYTSSEVPHLTIFELDGEDAGQPAAKIRERLSLACRGAPQLFVWKARNKDGATFEAEISLQPAAMGAKGRVIAMVRDVSKFIRAEEEASFFRALTEHTQEPLYVLDLGDGGRMFYANPAACRHFGVDLETLQTMRIPDWDPNFSRETAESIKERTQKEGLARIESEHLIASGAIVPVEITCNKIEYKGKTLGVGCFRNISERKHIDAELQRGREKLEKRVEERAAELAETMRALGNARDFLDKIINTITDPIYVMDREHKLVLVNDTLCAFFGRSRQELLSGSCEDLLAEVQMEAGLKKIETVFATEREYISEVEIADPQGRKHIFLAKKIPYKDLNGNTFIVGIARDITEKKQSMEALHLSQFCIDKAGIGIYQSDEYGTIFNVNEHACNSLGYTKEELCALSVFDIDPEITPERMLALKEAIDETGSMTHYTTHRRRDGSTFPVEITANYLDFRGRRYGISFVKDITDRKNTEEELKRQKRLLEDLNRTLEERVREIRRLNETLEERVAERTAELENHAQQMQQMAIELTDAEDRERRRIASILHDDFQQELAYIKLELGILQNKADLEAIQQRLEFLERIIGECIEKSRNLSYEMNPPALIHSGLIVALRELAQNMKTRFGLDVRVHVQHNVAPHSIVLESILFRSVRELLFNVIKHAGVGSAIIDVGSKNGMIHIQIKDFGDGFVYDPGRPRLGGGAGFGIWNIEDRITFLGGRMKITTAPGKGCCVELIVPKDVSRKVSMPAKTAGDDTSHREWVDMEPIQMPLSFNESSQIRILLADDHQMMREAMAKLLKDCKGMIVVGQANDGSEAVRLAAQLKPHVLLMDVTMPVLDGFEAAAQIKRDHPDIRIIGLSVHNDAHTRQKMLHAGASAYLTKSASPATLVETIRNVYSGNIIG
jgi:PAS domain S-box-containing protein